MADGNQMLDRRACAFGIGHRHEIDVALRGQSIDGHDVNRRGEERLVGAVPRVDRDEDDPGDTLGAEHRQDVALACMILVGIGQQQRIARGLQHAFDAADQPR